jgi:hypothetical protein
VLKTVDGIFTERYLSNLAEAWTWLKYDLYTLWNINYLIGDEFLDGECNEHAANTDTSYAALKRLRKEIKLSGHTRVNDTQAATMWKTCPVWLRSYLKCFFKIRTLEGAEFWSKLGYLSQTRGCGTPPPVVMIQSLRNFLETVITDPMPLPNWKRALIRVSINEVLEGIPRHHFTGLGTKAAVTVVATACWENTRKDGGTVQAIQDLVWEGQIGIPAKIIDLDTGQHVGHLRMSDTTAGTYIFWKSLEAVMSIPIEEVRKAFLTIVKEPGKGRSITKARACLKVVLDVVSKVCAYPLSKGMPSSQSGMKKSNQGWEFFKALHSERLEELVFNTIKVEKNEFASFSETTETYKALFASSTDYKEATDRMQHQIACELANPWMIHCGIPKVLRGIVIATCYRPRTICFRANGVLANYGQRVDKTTNSVTLLQGVLMGDPLTKVALHLVNIVVRTIARRLPDRKFLAKLTNQPYRLAKEIADATSNR